MAKAFLKFKSTVNVPKSVIIAVAFINACNAIDVDGEMFITSGNDSAHMKGSKHYSDEALDFRTKTLTAAQKSLLVAEVKKRLGLSYDVVFEDANGVNEHLHIEYDSHRS